MRDLFGAAGAWDSVRPRRLSDAVVRPRNFTVRRLVKRSSVFDAADCLM